MHRFFDWKRIVGILVAVGLLFLSFYKVNLRELWDTVKGVNGFFLLLAFVAANLMNWAKAMRWREIVVNSKKIPNMRILALFHVGQMINLSLPALTGQAGRIVMLAKQEGLSKTFCVTTVIVEVLFDGLSLIILMYAASFIFSFPPWVRDAEIIAAAAVGLFLLLIVIILRNERGLQYLVKKRVRRRFPRLYQKLERWGESISAGLDTLKSRTQILKVSFYSILVWLTHVAMAVLLLLAFGLHVPAWAGVVLIIVNSILLLIPISPGNIGSFQIVVIWSLSLFGVSHSAAVAFSLVMHFMDIFPVFVLGIVFLFTNHLTFRKLREETVEEAGRVGVTEFNLDKTV